MTRSVLVTGATGFLGSHLVRRLVHENWQVAVVVRPTSDLTPIGEVRTELACHEYDGTVGSLNEAMESARPDLVFHLASCFLWSHRPDQIGELVSSNILFGTQLAEAMCANGCTRLVNTGTSWQHYQNSDYSPVNLYAATKQAFEALLQYYVEAHQFRVVTLKLFDTYGPDDPRRKLFSVFQRAAEADQPVAMSPGGQLINLVHVDDVVDAFLLAAERVHEKTTGHERFAVTSAAPLKLRELAEAYERATDRRLNIAWGGQPYRSREVMRPWDRGQMVPGWSPLVGLHEGIRGVCGITKSQAATI